MTSTPPRLDALSIVVTDMAASLAFYRACGLPIPDEADTQPHVEITVAGGFRVMFDMVATVLSFSPGWSSPIGGHRMNVAFACGAPADVDDMYAHLTGLGYSGHHEPFDAVWGQRYAAVRDPDDTPVDFYAPLATT